MTKDNDALASLSGKTVVSIEGGEGDGEMTFSIDDGATFKMSHWTACCEGGPSCDICGDLKDLIGEPILQAEEVVSNDEPEEYDPEWYVWAFYKFATIKGSVTIRWFGSENYYSDEVTCLFEAKTI